MNGKPTLKQFVIINLVNNIPMSFVMSTAAPLLAGQPIEGKSFAANFALSFVLACVLNAIIPIPLIMSGFAKLLKLEPDSVPAKIVGNIPICIIFVTIIGLILTYYNVRLVPVFLFAFLDTCIPLYIICFIVTTITAPIAMKLAFGTK